MGELVYEQQKKPRGKITYTTPEGQPLYTEDGYLTSAGFKWLEKDRDIDILDTAWTAAKEIVGGFGKVDDVVREKGFLAGSANVAEGAAAAVEDFAHIGKGTISKLAGIGQDESVKHELRYQRYLDLARRSKRLLEERKSRVGDLYRRAGLDGMADAFDAGVDPQLAESLSMIIDPSFLVGGKLLTLGSRIGKTRQAGGMLGKATEAINKGTSRRIGETFLEVLDKPVTKPVQLAAGAVAAAGRGVGKVGEKGTELVKAFPTTTGAAVGGITGAAASEDPVSGALIGATVGVFGSGIVRAQGLTEGVSKVGRSVDTTAGSIAALGKPGATKTGALSAAQAAVVRRLEPGVLMRAAAEVANTAAKGAAIGGGLGYLAADMEGFAAGLGTGVVGAGLGRVSEPVLNQAARVAVSKGKVIPGAWRVHITDSPTKQAADFQTTVRWLANKPEHEQQMILNRGLSLDHLAREADAEAWIQGAQRDTGSDVDIIWTDEAGFKERGLEQTALGATVTEGKPVILINAEKIGRGRTLFHEIFHASERLDASRTEDGETIDPLSDIRAQLRQKFFGLHDENGNVLAEGMFDSKDIASFEDQYLSRLYGTNDTAIQKHKAKTPRERHNFILGELLAESMANFAETPGTRITTKAKDVLFRDALRRRLFGLDLIGYKLAALSKVRRGLENLGVQFDSGGSPLGGSSPLFKDKTGQQLTNAFDVDVLLAQYISTKDGILKRLNLNEGAEADTLVRAKDIVANPDLLQRYKDSGLIKLDEQGEIVYSGGRPVFTTAAERNRIAKDRTEAIVSALDSIDNDGSGLTKHTGPDGEVYYRGQRLSDQQLEKILELPDQVLPRSIKDKLEQIHQAIRDNYGQPLIADYYKALTGNRYDSRARMNVQLFVPIGMQISKASNFLVNMFSVAGLERKMMRWGRRQKFWEPWNGDRDSFRSDVLQYVRNQFEGRPGETGLNGDAAVKKKRIADMLNIVDQDLLPERLSTDSHLDKLIRSLRFDRMARLDTAMGDRIPLDYGKARVNYSPAEVDAAVAKANKSAASAAGGAVGAKAVLPRWVADNVEDKSVSLLDFGSGPRPRGSEPGSKPVHTQQLFDAGFVNVTAHDFGGSLEEGTHDLTALLKKHDVVMGSNVINTQSSREMLGHTLTQIAGATAQDGFAVMNYPSGPRYYEDGPHQDWKPAKNPNAPDNAEMLQLIGQYFDKVERVKNISVPTFKASQPKQIAPQQLLNSFQFFNQIRLAEILGGEIATNPGTAPVQHIGFQEGVGAVPGFHLYNLTRDVPGLGPAGTTLSEATIRDAGFDLPKPDSDVRYAPDPDRWPKQRVLEEYEAVGFVPTSHVQQILGGVPHYLEDVATFILGQRQKLLQGQITKRDLAKAYYMTVASQGTTAQSVAALKPKLERLGIRFEPGQEFLNTDTKGQPNIRPEEAAAWWLGTETGQRALNQLEQGVFDEAAWMQGADVRNAFNDDRVRNLGVLREATGKNKFNMRSLDPVLDEVNAAGANSAALLAAVRKLNGIGAAKEGFIGHMLGMGNAATADAVELNLWLGGAGHARSKDIPARRRALIEQFKLHSGSPEVMARFQKALSNRMKVLRRKLPGAAEIDPQVFEHIMHHWLWDRAKGIETTHQGMYQAMVQYLPDSSQPEQLPPRTSKRLSQVQQERIAALMEYYNRVTPARAAELERQAVESLEERLIDTGLSTEDSAALAQSMWDDITRYSRPTQQVVTGFSEQMLTKMAGSGKGGPRTRDSVNPSWLTSAFEALYNNDDIVVLKASAVAGKSLNAAQQAELLSTGQITLAVKDDQGRQSATRQITMDLGREFVAREAAADRAMLGADLRTDKDAPPRIYASVIDGQRLSHEGQAQVFFEFDKAKTPIVVTPHHHYGVANGVTDIHQSQKRGHIKSRTFGRGLQDMADAGAGLQVLDTPLFLGGPRGIDAARTSMHAFSITGGAMTGVGKAYKKGGLELAKKQARFEVLNQMLGSESTGSVGYRPAKSKPGKAAKGVDTGKLRQHKAFGRRSLVARQSNRTEAYVLDPDIRNVKRVLLKVNDDKQFGLMKKKVERVFQREGLPVPQIHRLKKGDDSPGPFEGRDQITKDWQQITGEVAYLPFIPEAAEAAFEAGLIDADALEWFSVAADEDDQQ